MIQGLDEALSDGRRTEEQGSVEGDIKGIYTSMVTANSERSDIILQRFSERVLDFRFGAKIIRNTDSSVFQYLDFGVFL